MEVDDFPSSKYSKLNSNNAKQRLQPSKIGFITTGTGDGGGTTTTVTATAATTAAMAAALNGGGGGGDVLGASTRFGRQWQHSSRIIRVSRASGGKDRHSKVWTAKGPRDRRVRLSVNTAIQFYDLQDRLGYDQPSKAVEWLIKAAADSINELPSLSNINFPPDTPRSGGNINNNNNSNCVIESGGAELMQQDQQQLQQVGSMSMSKSGCSSNNSETSKGSGLSLSRSEIRVKARERARERTAKEKDENLSSAARVTVAAAHNDNVSSMGQTSSFTQLLTAGINNLKDCTPTPSPHSSEQRAGRNMAVFCDTTTTTTPPMVDYCGTTTTGFMGLSSTHSHLGNGPLPHVMTLLPYSGSHEIQHQHQHQHQQQHQQLPFFLDHHHPLIQIPNNHNNTPNNAATGGGGGGGGGDYNLNFSISSASTTSGFNRGTLQSNSSSSPSFLSYLQRFSATDGGGGSSVPFFLGGAPISPIVDNQHYHHHHHDNHQQQYNSGGLHLNYGEGPPRHSDDKGKGKH